MMLSSEKFKNLIPSMTERARAKAAVRGGGEMEMGDLDHENS